MDFFQYGITTPGDLRYFHTVRASDCLSANSVTPAQAGSSNRNCSKKLDSHLRGNDVGELHAVLMTGATAETYHNEHNSHDGCQDVYENRFALFVCFVVQLISGGARRLRCELDVLRAVRCLLELIAICHNPFHFLFSGHAVAITGQVLVS